jgi:hypothetical protein
MSTGLGAFRVAPQLRRSPAWRGVLIPNAN